MIALLHTSPLHPQTAKEQAHFPAWSCICAVGTSRNRSSSKQLYDLSKPVLTEVVIGWCNAHLNQQLDFGASVHVFSLWKLLKQPKHLQFWNGEWENTCPVFLHVYHKCHTACSSKQGQWNSYVGIWECWPIPPFLLPEVCSWPTGWYFPALNRENSKDSSKRVAIQQ